MLDSAMGYAALTQYNLMKDKDPKLADDLYRYLYRDKIIFVDGQTAKNPQGAIVFTCIFRA